MERPLTWYEQLRQARKEHNWSQAYLAEKIGCDTKTVRRWERGDTVPHYNSREQLQKLLGLHIEEALPSTASETQTDDPPLQQEDRGEAPDSRSLYGRDEELQKLESWLVDDDCHIIAVLGVGGIGKTLITSALMERTKQHFTYIFWRSLQHAPPLQYLLLPCLQFISTQQQVSIPEDLDTQIRFIIQYLREYRCLLILDNFESVLQAGDLSGRYRAGYEAYGKLLKDIAEGQHQSCLILTSREKPKEVALLEGVKAAVRTFPLQGLQPEAGRHIIKGKHLHGSRENWETFVTSYAGNPLALTLVAQFIYEVCDSNIATFLKEGYVVVSEIEAVLKQQFERLSPLEQEILFWLAIEREAIHSADLQENIVQPITRRNLQEAIQSLQRRHLIEKNNLGITLQNVILEYVTERFINQVSKEVIRETPEFLSRYALIKAQAKDYLRESQIRSILSPIVERLQKNVQHIELERKLHLILTNLHERPHIPDYTAGNLLNMLLHLGYDVRGYDFSHLSIRQAYLQNAAVAGVDFTGAQFLSCAFTETFGSILSVAWSSDGQKIIAGTTNCEIRLWQTPESASLRIYTGHSDWVRSVAFGKDNRTIISGSEDHTIRIWDADSDRCLKILSGHHNRIDTIALSPDATIIASGSEDRSIRLWEVSTGKCPGVLYGHSQWAWSVSFSPDGKLLASGGEDHMIHLWDIASKQSLRILQGHKGRVQSVAFHPKGHLLASCGDDQAIRFWQVDNGQCLRVLHGHNGWVWTIAFSPDGKLLASGGEDRTIRLWEIESGLCQHILTGHSSRVRSLAFCPDGKTLLSGGDDQSLRRWDVKNCQALKTLQGYTSWLYTITFHPQEKVLASGGTDGVISLWDITKKQCIKTLRGHTNLIRDIHFSPDGKTIVSGSDDHTIRFWEASSGNCLQTLHRPTAWIRALAFHPDGQSIVGGCEDNLVRLWDTSTGECIRAFRGHTNRVWSVAFSPDGRTIASGSEDHTICLWETNTGELLKTFSEHTDQVRSVAFNARGTLLASGSEDWTIRIWDASTGQCIAILPGHTGRLHCVAFSPDGSLLVSGSEDWTVRLWNLTEGTSQILQGHTNRVRAVAFHADGKTVASASHDETMKLWDIHTGLCIETLRTARPYEGTSITDARGLTTAQKSMLKALGAIE